MSLEDRYDISAPIHIGQIATAYPATEKGSSRKVLLKIIHPQFADDQELVMRFEREGHAMSVVDHPNVVKVYDHGKEENIPYLVLEWVEGGNLLDKIKNGPLDQKKVKELSADILSGLEAVHKTGLIHRDLKPDNILICHNGSAKLGDFSLSGFVNPSGLTEHDAIIGTPAYFAPELVNGSSATIASDLYSVGMILFESLTGSNPFSDVDPIIALGMIHKTKLPRLSEKAGIDSKLAALVDSLLSRNASDRPATAADALNMLSGIIQPTKRKIRQRINRDAAIWATFVSIISGIILVLIFLVEDNGGNWDPPLPAYIVIDRIVSEPMADTRAPSTPNLNATEVIPIVTPIPVESYIPREVIIEDPVLPAYLTIIVLPWARVFQDNEEIGLTPLGTRLISVGNHKFRFVNKDFPQIEKIVNIFSGTSDTLRLDLREESSRLEFAAKPWGYLWVDDDSIGLLPRGDPVWLSEGVHSLRIHHPSLLDWIDTIIVAKGSQHNYSVDLSKQLLETNLLIE